VARYALALSLCSLPCVRVCLAGEREPSFEACFAQIDRDLGPLAGIFGPCAEQCSLLFFFEDDPFFDIPGGGGGPGNNTGDDPGNDNPGGDDAGPDWGQPVCSGACALAFVACVESVGASGNTTSRHGFDACLADVGTGNSTGSSPVATLCAGGCLPTPAMVAAAGGLGEPDTTPLTELDTTPGPDGACSHACESAFLRVCVPSHETDDGEYIYVHGGWPYMAVCSIWVGVRGEQRRTQRGGHSGGAMGENVHASQQCV
jgi:hypothetical protein